jgi:hypothetical protein
MDILATIRREERKLEKQLGKLQYQLRGIRAAAKALGDSMNRELSVFEVFGFLSVLHFAGPIVQCRRINSIDSGPTQT